MTDHHTFQSTMCSRFDGPVLNVASHDDPAFLGDKYGAINLDNTTKFNSGATVEEVKNFVLGDAFALPEDWTDRFGVVVLGEFLEHCIYDVAVLATKECVRVCKPGGVVVFTFPYDDRPPFEQHPPEECYECRPGFTSFHQTIWKDDILASLFKDCGLEEILRCSTTYYLTRVVHGLGVAARKLA